jgi:hypothetical protein
MLNFEYNKMRLKTTFLLLLAGFLFSSGRASAQWISCVDSLRVNPFYPCQGSYIPVCGCDNITYRNDCAAYMQGGVNQYMNGVCTYFDFDIVPTYISQSTGPLNLTIQFREGEQGSGFIRILDLYGKIDYTYVFSSQHRISLQLEPYLFNHGLHFVQVISNGEMMVKRFLKIAEH